MESGEWVSVEERLPECGGDVLGTDGFHVDLCRYHGSRASGFSAETYDPEYFQKVTHWMYLPEPPE